MNEIKHPEYIPVHILLILGAFFMLFPFVWMICASFKSNQEIIKSSTEKIVVLPDSIRPRFLNDKDDTDRIHDQEGKDKAWQVVEDKFLKPLQEKTKLETGKTLEELSKEIDDHNKVRELERNEAWFKKDKEIQDTQEKIKKISSQIIIDIKTNINNEVKKLSGGLSIDELNKEINNHYLIVKDERNDAWKEKEAEILAIQEALKNTTGLTIDEFNKDICNIEDANSGLKINEIRRKIDSHENKKPFEWWDNYKNALKAQPFYRFFLNTLFVSITVTAVSLFFASLAAYAFAFFNFPGKNIVFLMILGTMMLPQQALLIPNYIMLSKIHWINTYLALTVPWLASAYAVFFLRQFFMQLPKDLFEAAIIDGCSRFGFYWRVALPLCKPSLVTMGVFSFLSNWNAFVWPLIVTNDTNLRVIQVGLSYFSSDAGNEWGQLMAASTMTILPLVIMYFFAQKQFVESSATSGMKE